MPASTLLRRFLPDLLPTLPPGPVLDLACGSGRNGLYLLANDLPVVFADADPAALETVAAQLADRHRRVQRRQARLWQVDLERADLDPLAAETFAAIIVFRYLHRPLFPAIRRAVAGGGLVIYESFTCQQARYGRPKNPDFLLQPGELRAQFDGWQILHSFEGVVQGTSGPQAIAQLVALNNEGRDVAPEHLAG